VVAGLHSPTLAPASEHHHRHRQPSRRPHQAAWTSWTRRTGALAVPATALPTLMAAAAAAAVHGEGVAPVAPADRAAPAVPAAEAAAALASLRARRGSRWRPEPRSNPPSAPVLPRAPTWRDSSRNTLPLSPRVELGHKAIAQFVPSKFHETLQSVEEVPQRGGGFEEATREESEWARGVVTADGGNAPLGQGQAVSPPPPSRPHTTTPLPRHISKPTPPLLRVFTRSVHSASTVVLLLYAWLPPEATYKTSSLDVSASADYSLSLFKKKQRGNRNPYTNSGKWY
jgi:hypothetical protein